MKAEIIAFLNNRKTLGRLLIAAAFIAAGILLMAIFKPALGRAKELVGEKKQLAAKVNVLTQTVNNFKAIDYEKEQVRLADIDLLIPEDNDVLQGLNLVEALAANHGLELLSNRAGVASQNESSLKGFEVQAVVRGSYAAIKNFLADIYLAKRATGIGSLSLAASEESAEISATVNFFFPVRAGSGQPPVARGEIGTTFSDEDNELIAKLLERSVYFEATTSATLGRTNPFAKP